PCRISARKVLPEAAALSLNAATINHPALVSLRDSSELTLSAARFSVVYEMTGPPGDDAVRVLCRFDGGQPAFAERRVGQGRVILSASTAGTSGNTLPLRGAYLPLMHQLVAYLGSGPGAQRNLYVGEPISARFDVPGAGKRIRVSTPA